MAKISSNPKTMSELFELMGDKLLPISQGDVMEVTVVSASRDHIVVDVAGLATGIIPDKELGAQATKLKPGDKVRAYVLSVENDNGYVILSLKRAEREEIWRSLEQRNTHEEIINVKIVQANKGGLVAEYNSIQGFIPVSQLSVKNYPRVGGDKLKIRKKLTEMIGTELPVKIINYDKSSNKIIFSEKAAVESDLEEKAQQFEIGQRVKGKITGIVDFGLFVDIGDIEGLIHISQVSWQRVSNLREHFQVGQEIEAEVVNIDGGRVSLSMKKLQPDPWQTETKKLKIGSKLKGLVTQVTPYGAFVKLSDNLEGLFHVSQMIPSNTDKSEDVKINPSDIIQEGKSYDFEIISVEPELRKISLKLA